MNNHCFQWIFKYEFIVLLLDRYAVSDQHAAQQLYCSSVRF